MPKRKGRPVVHAVTVLALLAGSAYFTFELRKDAQAKVPAVQSVTDNAMQNPTPATGRQTWERLNDPARSVLRDAKGAVIATFTDGARAATLKGASRTFTEPANTSTKVITDDWVRLMPEPWTKGAQNQQWYKDWFKQYYGSEEDDIFAIAFQYVQGAPLKKDAAGVPYRGDAVFGPYKANGVDRLEQNDFYDYLGIPYTFRNGTTMPPRKERYRALDCSGFMRMVWGYRARYPLMATDKSGDGLPRSANGMARSKVGVDIIKLRGPAPGTPGRRTSTCCSRETCCSSRWTTVPPTTSTTSPSTWGWTPRDTRSSSQAARSRTAPRSATRAVCPASTATASTPSCSAARSGCEPDGGTQRRVDSAPADGERHRIPHQRQRERAPSRSCVVRARRHVSLVRASDAEPIRRRWRFSAGWPAWPVRSGRSTAVLLRAPMRRSGPLARGPRTPASEPTQPTEHHTTRA